MSTRVTKRLLLIVPGHQSGPCGIMDYSWLLASSVDAEWEVHLVAMHRIDANWALPTTLPSPVEGKIQIHSLAALPFATKLERLKALVEELKPDLINLQFPAVYVTAKRFTNQSMLKLARVLRGRSVQVTVHESWTRPDEPASVGNFIKRQLRRFEITTSLRALRPTTVYVSNSLHAEQLRAIGLAPILVPVFSNVRRHPLPEGVPDLAGVLKILDPTSVQRLPAAALVAATFARISPDWDPGPSVAALTARAASEGKTLAIVSIGETGYGDMGWKRLVSAAGPTAFMVRLGRRSEREISWLLQVVEVGLSPTPLKFWTKSSSCAAMVVHDVPMIFPDTEIPGGIPLPPRFALMDYATLTFQNAPDGGNPAAPQPGGAWAQLLAHARNPL
jgi:hypothetical protein